MSVKSRIIDPGTGISANVETNAATGKNGVLVLTEDFLSFDSKNVEFISEEQGTAMNQDASFGGTPIEVHNGGDNAYWTGASIIGTSVDFASTNQFNTGAQSVEVLGPAVLDTWEFDKGSNQDLTNYAALSFYVYVDRRWTTDSVEVFGWDGTAQVGIRVKIEDYFNATQFDTWQFVAIPLSDMNLATATIQAFRFQYVTKAGASVEFYLDDIQIEETSGEIEYKAIAPTEKPYRANELVVTITDVFDSALTNSNMYGLAPSGIVGLGQLTNGVLFTKIEEGITTITQTFRSLEDFLSYGFAIDNAVSDSISTCIVLCLRFGNPLLISGAEEENFISFTIRDDLSGLTTMKATLRGISEISEK